MAFIFDETMDKIDTAKDKSYDAVVLHYLSNEIKTTSPETCVRKLISVVTKCHNTWPDAKIVVSLATPRLDGLTTTAELTNAIIKYNFKDKGVSLCDNNNLALRRDPQEKFLTPDKFHPNKAVVAKLAENLKSSICSALNIPIFDKRKSGINNQQSKTPRRRRPDKQRHQP